MKMDKQLRKEYIKKIQEKAKKSGYKAPLHMFYKVQDDNLLYAYFTIIPAGDLVYRLETKKMSFDNIFWTIMDMEDNIRRGNTLRVNGAFTASGILISGDNINLTDDMEGIAEAFVDNATSEFANFMDNNDIIDYIFSHDQIFDWEILKCLAYIDADEIAKAVDLAREQIEKGDRGRFVNANKGFFERVILKYA